MAALTHCEEGCLLAVRLQPRASKNEILGITEGRLRVRVQSPPVGGAANKQCRQLLARTLGLSKARVTLLQGEKSRDKVFLLSGISAREAFHILEQIHLTT